MSRYVVAVSPPAALSTRARLLAALEAALPVRFEAREPGAWGGASAAVLLGAERFADSGIPTFSAPSPEDVTAGETRPVRFGDDDAVDRRLRGQSLGERHVAGQGLTGAQHATVLAATGTEALWLVRGRAHEAAAAPAELAPGEPLRNRLRPGRFLALLPLFHFLRTLSADAGWTPPPLRACFILDDPNLHLPSYGHVRYEELARAANRFHVAIAMVPLDGWFAHPGAARLFRERPERLSVLVHGNDHIGGELARPARDDEALAVAAQALRRVESFERRTGISVARVMTPPHGRCSEASMRALLRTGFEAACISRPYPWLDRPPEHRHLAEWEPAEFVAGGLPVLPRYSLESAREDVVLRAFLDQPLILYGHHGDLAPGGEALADAAAGIDRLGDIQWLSPREIARTNVSVLRRGDELHVLLFARRASVTVPAGVQRIVPHLPGSHDGDDAELGLEPTPVEGTGTVELELVRRDAVDPYAVNARPWRPWPLARRFLTEGRDRIQPLVWRATRAQARTRS